MEAMEERPRTKSRKKHDKRKSVNKSSDTTATKDCYDEPSTLSELKPPDLDQSVALSQNAGPSFEEVTTNSSDIDVVSQLLSNINAGIEIEETDQESSETVSCSTKTIESAPPCEDQEEETVISAVIAAPAEIKKPLTFQELNVQFEIEKTETLNQLGDMNVQLMPFSQSQLAEWYTNTELKMLESFVTDFIHAELKGNAFHQHQLYELLVANLQARKNLTNVMIEIKEISLNCETLQQSLWSVQSVAQRKEGECADGNTVYANYTFNKATFNRNNFKRLAKDKNKIQELINTSVIFYNYLVRTTFMQIEHHLHNVISPILTLKHILPSTDIVLNMSAPTAHIQRFIGDLRLCISILFQFQRKAINDTDFVSDVRKWVELLIAVLLRVATWQDHLFILNHVLRLPPGFGSWAVKFIQAPMHEKNDSPFSSYEINHVVVTLATILLPIEKREQFLVELTQQPDVVEAIWVVVDSDGEDDDDNSMVSLKENDLVSLLNQLPLECLFRKVLCYDSRHIEETVDQNHILKLFSFCTVILQILHKGLSTYNQARYLQLCKRLSRFMRHIIQYATDQLEIFCTSSNSRNQSIYDRIRIEYDMLFMRAFYYLFISEKLGSWQFLAVLPYHAISGKTLWKIFYFLHDFDSSTNSLLESTEYFNYQSKMWTASFRSAFEETCSKMPEDECYYFLSTIANMALSRKDNDIEFLKCATFDILHIGFISETTQETCAKNCRIQLTHITSKYPSLLSDIFRNVYENIGKIGTLGLYLYDELPISIWKIEDEDLSCLETWLVQKPFAAVESKLARMIIARLNWDMGSNGELFLPFELHANIAQLLVTVIEIDPSYANWAWQTAVRLRLHISDKGVKSFDQVKDVEFYTTIAKGVREQNPLASFFAVLVSSWGHLIPLICSKGFDQLLFLQVHQKHEAVLFALNHIMPLFLNCQESIINLDRFEMVLVGLLNADRTYINMAKSLVVSQNTILEQFANMIHSQIANYKSYKLESPRYVVRLWVDSLVSVTNWRSDPGVMYLLNIIIQGSLFYPDAMDVICNTLRDLLQATTPQEQSKSLTSLFKWASTSGSQNMLINMSLSSYPYLAIVIIDLEHEEREKSTNLWTEILQQINSQKGKINVDAAIKKACAKYKIPAFASSSLCIFRWAQQALDTAMDHPIAILFWQKFFCLYLHHVQVSPQETVCVGEKFFDGVINQNFLKRMKRKLQETISFYKEKTRDSEFRELEPKMQQYYLSAHKIFNAFGLWLEEPRLQEPTLYVQGIPPQYEPHLLNIVLQGNCYIWLEYINQEAIQEVLVTSIKTWNQANYRERKNINQPCKSYNNGEGSDPWERIKHRLESYDKPQLAPQIIVSDLAFPPLDLNNKKELSRIISKQLELLTTSAHEYTVESSKHIDMDRKYESLIVKLYISTSKTYMKKVLCTKTANNVHCSGPAKITYNVIESKINDAITTVLNDFNAEYESFIEFRLKSGTVFCKMCYASVFLEHIITLLEKQRVVQSEANSQGIELFYQILALINEETTNYYPTKKLFGECLERLGRSYVHGVEEETPKLLDKILKEPSLGTYLAPHFSPAHVGTANFLMMYSMITKGLRQNYDLLYSLLSKFDATKWLQGNMPKLSQRSQFIELVVKVLVEMGPDPQTEAQPLHELFRKHLVAVFRHCFPEHYGEVLIHILKASTGAVNDCIAISVWLDILSVLAHPKQIVLKSETRNQLRHYAQNQICLSYQVLMETTLMLSQHYTAERLQYGLYGLYPKTLNYVEVISLFLGMTGHSFIVSALNTHQGMLGENVCELIWPYLRDMFAPWLVPYWTNNIKEEMATWIQQLTDDRAVILPWIPANTPYAQKVMNMFSECILFVIQTLPASNNIMSFLWQWYASNFAYIAIKDHVINVIHQSLISLPWQKFWPSVHDMELMLKITEQCLPESHTFLGHVFLEISWSSWVAYLGTNVQQQVKVRMYHCLLNLIIKLGNEPNIRRNASEKTLTFLSQAGQYEWQFLEPQSIQQTMDWYIMSCDSTVILKSNTNNLDEQLLNFIRIICCYDKPYSGNDTIILQKRQTFIRTFAKLVAVFASKNKGKINDLLVSKILGPQLAHLELVVLTEQEMNVLLGELLVVLNKSCLQEHALNFVAHWIRQKEGSDMIIRVILQSIGNYVSDVEPVATLYETAIDTFFTNNVGNLDTVSWKYISPVLKPHVKYNSLVTNLIENGHLLTLHALLLEKIKECDDKVTLLNLCLLWFGKIKVNDTNEFKIPLLWTDFLLIVSQYIYANEAACGEYLHKFSVYLCQLADQNEGAKWAGLLGAIGIGKKTDENLQFKFICRALAGYILSQLPETRGLPQTIRKEAGASCAVGQPGGNADVPKILLKMDFGQNQGKIKEQAEKVLIQIQDPQNSLHNLNIFLRNVLLVSYTKPYLREI